jgi:hypothetical protein
VPPFGLAGGVGDDSGSDSSQFDVARLRGANHERVVGVQPVAFHQDADGLPLSSRVDNASCRVWSWCDQPSATAPRGELSAQTEGLGGLRAVVGPAQIRGQILDLEHRCTLDRLVSRAFAQVVLQLVGPVRNFVSRYERLDLAGLRGHHRLA